MRYLVCGGRDYEDWNTLVEVLDRTVSAFRPHTLIHGGARGADHLAGTWAKHNGMETQVYPADWDKHGTAAGPIRNKQMLDEGKPALVIAFPGGRGTENMIQQARKAGVPVLRVEP